MSLYISFFLCPHLLTPPPPPILPSLSLLSPDDSRTPALAQTWPTLTWNTRCAEEDEDEGILEGGGRQGWLSVRFQYNQLKQKCHLNRSCRPIVHQYFVTGLIWSFSHGKHFWDIILYYVEDRNIFSIDWIEGELSPRQEGFKSIRTQQTWAKNTEYI